MELKMLCLLVTVGVLNVETKIMKDFGKDHGDTKADATTRISTPSELFFTFYKSNASSPSSPVATSSIKSCIAASKAPKTVTIGIYALKAAGGTVFLRHRLNDQCVPNCFEKYRFATLAAETFKSCADGVESSGWANSFTFVDDECVGYATWMHSMHTQGSPCDGNSLFYIAENKINNFTGYTAPFVITQSSVSRIVMDILNFDICLATNTIEVTTLVGSKTFNNTFVSMWYRFDQYNISLCSMNPPVAANTVNVTLYDYDGKVLWKETAEGVGPKPPGGSMHPFSGDYGDLCVYQLAKQYTQEEMPCGRNSAGTATEFRRTSFLTFAAYRTIISSIPNVPSHFIGAHRDDDGNWRWKQTEHVIGAEDFVAGVYPSVTDEKCLLADADANYFLAPIQCSTALNIVCVDFSRLSYNP